MADCIVVNNSLTGARDKMVQLANSYNELGEQFVTDLLAALDGVEGASKDAFVEYINNNVKELTSVRLGELVNDLAELLEGNRNSFEQVDSQLAALILESQG